MAAPGPVRSLHRIVFDLYLPSNVETTSRLDKPQQYGITHILVMF